MKISKLNKLAGVFFALAVVSTSTFAQGWGNQNRSNKTQAGTNCINRITDLTEQQKSEIQALQVKHQEEMTVLREKRRSTTDIQTKNTIRDEMLGNKVAHQDAVKSLLSSDQQKQYNLIQAGGGLHLNRNSATRAGSGNRGNGFRQGRGDNRMPDCPRLGQGKQGNNARFTNCTGSGRRGRI